MKVWATIWGRLVGRPPRPTPPIVIVSGLPRSGTSMMMQMLAAGGIDPLTDDRRQADADNPKGYFELETVKQLATDASWLEHAPGKAVKIISSLLRDLPPREPPYKVIFMERDIREVLASQAIMLRRRGKSDPEIDDDTMAEQLTQHVDATKAWLRTQPHLDTLYITHANALSHPRATAQAVQQFIAQPLNIDAMAATVDPALHRNRA